MRPRDGGERGSALVVALLVLLTLAAIATMMLVNISVDTKSSSTAVLESRALNLAEAGVGEALERIRSGDVPDNLDPMMVTQIFLAAPDRVPALGADSTALATSQPAGSWLDYSSPARGPDVLTIRYRTDPARTLIYRYDRTLIPPVQTGSGQPIFVVTSTGRKGKVLRRIDTEVTRISGPIKLFAAVAASGSVTGSSSGVICGHEHRAETPTGTAWSGRTGRGGCAEDPLVRRWETGAGDATGVWAGEAMTCSGPIFEYGIPRGVLRHQTGFYAGPWDVLGMSESAFFDWLGPSQSFAPPNPTGLVHLDNDSIRQNAAGSFKYTGRTTGSGLLYVDGDLVIGSPFNYRGLIYVEGNLYLQDGLGLADNCWILGAVVARGSVQFSSPAGSTAILMSSQAVAQNLNKTGNGFATLSWREFP